MKILVNCFACSPYRGSEPGMGWNFVSNLCRLHELHIITEYESQPDLERYFDEHPQVKENMHVYYLSKPSHETLRKIWPPSYYWFYKKWQKKALALALELDKKEHFDIVHQLNMIGYREPGYLWKMNIPLVWGPIGGFQMTPWKLLPSMGLKGFVFYASRNLINLWQMRFNRRVRIMAQKASQIICASQDGYNAVTKLWKREAVIIPEVGLTSIPNDNVCAEKDDGMLHLCWSGLHEPRKSLNLLLEAINICQNREHICVNVIGDGPSNKKWKRLAKRLGLNHVNWYGWVSREDSLKVMQSSHAFVITSLCDDTTTVVLEALSMGLPVVALKLSGFANVLTDECGIRIDVHSKEQVERDMARAIDRLYEDKSYRHSLGQGATNRAQDFTWDKKVQTIYDIYSRIVKS